MLCRVFMLNIVMLNVVLPSVFMTNVVATLKVSELREASNLDKSLKEVVKVKFDVDDSNDVQSVDVDVSSVVADVK